MSGLLVGDRLVRDGEYVLEWTIDNTWTMVCAIDDVAMTVHNDDRELCCAICGGNYREVAKIA
jgi:hypothetical protein